ncbi:hypothetical protein [Streptomyces sp. Y7]|uniref:hypothetical protein n=1 Tax=Streptomyces sp. Y7 TaxID=3342392 RepID=UPI00371C46FE
MKTATDGRGTAVTFTYDHRDRITKVNGPTGWAEYAWDGDGNLKQRSDATQPCSSPNLAAPQDETHR